MTTAAASRELIGCRIVAAMHAQTQLQYGLYNASTESMGETANLFPRLVPWWATYPATPTLRHAQLDITQKRYLKTPSYAAQSLPFGMA